MVLVGPADVKRANNIERKAKCRRNGVIQITGSRPGGLIAVATSGVRSFHLARFSFWMTFCEDDMLFFNSRTS